MKRTTLAVMITLTLASVSAMAANDWKDTAKDAWIDGKAETTVSVTRTPHSSFS